MRLARINQSSLPRFLKEKIKVVQCLLEGVALPLVSLRSGHQLGVL